MSDNPLEQFLNKHSKKAQEYIGIIEEMLDDDKWDYAYDTLAGIRDDIEEHERITDAQVQAVENIKSKPSEHYGRRN